MHRDLKPSNILFGLDGRIRVGDLGLVKEFSDNTLENKTVSETTSCEHTREIGTPSYLSPEQKANGNYDHTVDVYALGLILVELLHPYKTANERVITLRNARLHQFPLGLPSLDVKIVTEFIYLFIPANYTRTVFSRFTNTN